MAVATLNKGRRQKKSGLRIDGPWCPACELPLPVQALPTQTGLGTVTCPKCRKSLQAIRFDPPGPVAVAAQRVTADDQPACLHHPANAAACACDRCGALICDLCRLDLGGQVCCPTCSDHQRSRGELAATRNRYVNYAAQAMAVGLGSLLCFPIGLGGAGAILLWRANVRQNRRTGERFGPVLGPLGAVFGVLAMLACVGFWYAIVVRRH